MEKLKTDVMEINDSTNGIGLGLEVIDGQMTFFSHLIQNIEQYKNGTASMLMHGELEKQLNAIYYLFHNQLEEIRKHNEEIRNLSEGEKLNEYK